MGVFRRRWFRRRGQYETRFIAQSAPAGSRTAGETWGWTESGALAATYAKPRYAPSCDGTIRNQGTGSFATLRAAATGTAADPTNEPVACQSYFDGTTRTIDRVYFAFDTSGIAGSTDVVEGALWVYVPSRPVGASAMTGSLCLVAASQASSVTLTTSDFGSVGTTELADRIPLATLPTGWVQIKLNAAGRAAISKGGTTKLALRESHDLDNTQPAASADEYALIAMSEHAGTSQDPFLEVLTAPSPGAIERWGWTDNAAPYWRARNQPVLVKAEGANTTLNGAQNATAATLTVASTAGFPSSGTIYLQDTTTPPYYQAKVAYTGKTATTFTGCTSSNSLALPSGAAVAARDAESNFPQITVLDATSKPRFLDSYTSKPGHSGYDAQLLGKVTADGGLTWGAERTILAAAVNNSVTGGCMSGLSWGIGAHTALLCADGTLFVAWYEGAGDGVNVYSYSMRGTPDGAGWFTFDTPVKIPTPFAYEYNAIGPGIIEDGGHIYLTVYGRDTSPTTDPSYSKLIRTSDKGATGGGWSTVATIATVAQTAGVQNAEASLSPRTDGSWLIQLRVETATKSRYQTTTSDQGGTLSTPTLAIQPTGGFWNLAVTHLMPEGHIISQGGGPVGVNNTRTYFSTDDGANWPSAYYRDESTDATYNSFNGSDFATIADTSIPGRRVVNTFSQERSNQAGAQVKFQWYQVPNFPLATEAWAWTDSAARSVAAPRTAAETWAWSESPAGATTGARTAGETWAWAESATQITAHGYTRTAAETWAWSDNTARAALTYTRGASEAWAWTDGVSRVVSSVNGDPSIVLHTMLAAGATLGAYLVREWKGQILSKWNPTPGMLQATATVDDWGLAPFYGLAPGEYVAWSPERPRARTFFTVT